MANESQMENHFFTKTFGIALSPRFSDTHSMLIPCKSIFLSAQSMGEKRNIMLAGIRTWKVRNREGLTKDGE